MPSQAGSTRRSALGAWRRLAEFTAAAGQPTADQLAATLAGRPVPRACLEHAAQALDGALEDLAGPGQPATIRVFLAGSDRRTSAGWSFFTVERGHPSARGVDLFIYQEQAARLSTGDTAVTLKKPCRCPRSRKPA